MKQVALYILIAWVVVVLANAGQLDDAISAIFNGLNSCSAQIPSGQQGGG